MEKNKYTGLAMFEQYLELAHLTKIPVDGLQYIETKRAFFGALGKLMLVIDEVATEPEQDQHALFTDLFDEVDAFWKAETNKNVTEIHIDKSTREAMEQLCGMAKYLRSLNDANPGAGSQKLHEIHAKNPLPGVLYPDMIRYLESPEDKLSTIFLGSVEFLRIYNEEGGDDAN